MSDYKFHEMEKPTQGPPVQNELAVVNLPVSVVFEWSDKIIEDADYTIDGQIIESSIIYKSGWVMQVLPGQRVVYQDHERTTIGFSFKEK